MAYMKFIVGYNNLCDAGCRDYLLGTGRWYKKYHGDRCKNLEFINTLNCGKSERWDKEFDENRKAFDTNEPKYGHKKCQRYHHYIFSPDPKDNITEEELSSALHEWCKRCFQDKFQIVIGYHKDNENKIQHAHLYINNINLDCDKGLITLGNYTSPNFINYSRQLWQYICEDRGWYNFLEKQKEDIKEAERTLVDGEVDTTKDSIINKYFAIDKQFFREHKFYNPNINYKYPYKKYAKDENKSAPLIFKTKNGRYYTKGARERKAKGLHLWTDDIRDLIETAYYQSSNPREFEQTLLAFDIDFETTSSGDYKFSHPNVKNHPRWVVTGAKLGKDYTRKRINNLYTLMERNNKYNTPKGEQRKKLIQQVREIGYTKETRYISFADNNNNNNNNNNNKINLTDIANTMRINSFFNVWKIEDYNKLLSNLDLKNDKTIIEQLLFAQETMKKLNNLPPVRANYDKKHNIDWNKLKTKDQIKLEISQQKFAQAWGEFNKITKSWGSSSKNKTKQSSETETQNHDETHTQTKKRKIDTAR